MVGATSADTLRETQGGLSATAVHPHLFAALECDRPAAGASRHSLADLDEVVIGRGSTRSATRSVVGGKRRLVLRIPGARMSASHARLFVEDGRWVLEDAGSTNGTFCAGDRVQHLVLRDDDVFDAGRTILLFRAALPTPEHTPVDLVIRPDDDPSPTAFSTLIPALAAQNRSLAQVATSPLPVLLMGETGTGKEVLARAIHQASAREGAFVAVNCGALPASLVEGQLFGHVRGAFSGAIRDEPGFVRSAENGTLFLDEIGDLALASQATLLRVLQEREVVPIGSARPMKVDVRIVAATHQDLPALVAAGKFRADLFARLDGFAHRLEPLRARRGDLGLLVASLLTRMGAASRVVPSIEVGRALFAYDWPANVRELEQCLARTFALAPGGRVDLALLPDAVRRATLERPGNAAPRAEHLSEEDAQLRKALVAQLEEHRGNVADVARAMGKARMQIHRWIKRFQLDPRIFRRPG